MSKNFRTDKQLENFWQNGFQNPLDYFWNGYDAIQEAEEKPEDPEIDAIIDTVVDMMADSLCDLILGMKHLEMETAQKQYGENADLALFATPDGRYTICSWDEAASYMSHNKILHGNEAVFGGMLAASFDLVDVICFGGDRYLSGPMIIYGLDENGEECSLDFETFIHFFANQEKYRTKLEVDGNRYPVFRLD